MPLSAAPRSGRAPLALAALAAVATVTAAPARAQVTTYGTPAAFQAVLAPGAFTEDFESIGRGIPGGLNRFEVFGGAPFGFRAAVPGTATNSFLYLSGDPSTRTDPANPSTATETALSTELASEPITITFVNSANPVTAFGGRFFLANQVQSLIAGSVTVTARTVGGQQAQTTLNYASAPANFLAAQFAGFTATAADPFSQVTISSATPNSYVTADNVTAGARAVAAAVPEPGTAALALPLLGTLGLAAGARTRRQRAA